MNTKLKEKLEEIGSVGDVELRVTRRIEIGSAVQQGEVYIHCVADDHPRGEPIGVGSVQIAMGAGNGARHVAEGDGLMVFRGKQMPDDVRVSEDVEPEEMLGPVIAAPNKCRITHPEHPHHQLPVGTYQVTYQYDPNTMRRVID